MGATPFLIGLATFASAIPEVVVLLFADKLFDAVGPDWMLLGAGILITARWFLYYFLHNMYLILPVQVLHALTAMPIVFAMTTYVSRSVPPGLRSSGQAMFGLAFFGVARLAGTLLGGWLGERVGVRTMFLYNAMFVAVTTLVFAATSVRRVRPSAERQFQLPG
jgi:PPP family 3-phenylpropionic acid transporter